MNTRSIMLILLGPIVVLGAVAFGVRYHGDSIVLRFQDDLLDLGSVWSQDGFEVSIPIENASGNTVSVAAFRHSCACTSIHPESLTLAPGETSLITLTADLSHPPPALSTPGPTRKLDLEIVPIIDEHGPTHPVIFQGIVKHSVLCDPQMLSFVGVVRGRQAEPQVMNIRPMADGIVDLVVDGPSWISTSTEVQVDNSFITQFSVDPDHDFGPKLPTQLQTELHLNPVLRDGATLPPVRVPIVVTAHSDLSVLPSVVSLGTVQANTAVDYSIVISSRTGRSWELASVETTSECKVSESIVGSTCELTCRFLFPGRNSLGHHEGLITVKMKPREGQSLTPFNIPWHAFVVPGEQQE